MKESTQQRFSSKTGPDGEDWARNSEVTQWAPKKLPTGGYRIKGRDDPLTAHGTLGNTIDYQLLGHSGVQIGSPLEYAAMMQFGGTKAEFPKLWGDIPARPFLGISDEDEPHVLDIIRQHLENAI